MAVHFGTISEREKFDVEWTRVCAMLKSSGADLSKIKIALDPNSRGAGIDIPEYFDYEEGD